MDHIVSMVERRPLVVFSRSGCPMSHAVKALMRDFGANTTVYELDQLRDGLQVEAALLQMMGARSGGRLSAGSVPAVYIGQQFVGGADAVMSLHLQNKLVPMLLAAGAIFLWHRQAPF